MKDYVLIFGLAFVLWLWLNLYARRIGKQKMMGKETSKILQKRFENKIKRREKQEPTDKAPKKIDGFEQVNRRFEMNAYPYIQQERRADIERRKSRVQVGLIFENIDPRRVDSTKYKGIERRRVMDRRGNILDRRKPKIACYS
jgi:hypothetical protein